MQLIHSLDHSGQPLIHLELTRSEAFDLIRTFRTAIDHTQSRSLYLFLASITSDYEASLYKRFGNKPPESST